MLNTGNIEECEGAGLGRNLNEEGVTKLQPDAEQLLMRVLGLKLKSMIVSLLQGALPKTLPCLSVWERSKVKGRAGLMSKVRNSKRFVT